MITTNKKFLSTQTDQQKLSILSTMVMERFDEIMDCLQISLDKQNKMFVGQCPIHQGDRFNALNIYHTGDVVGNWVCHTQHCEKTFVGSVIGFIRGILSRQKGWTQPGDKIVSFKDTLLFISSCLNEDYNSIEVNTDSFDKLRFVQQVSLYKKNRQVKQQKNLTTRGTFRQDIVIPAEYFIQRGFSPEILNKYDIGLCTNPRTDLYNRIVVPLYDDDYTYVIGTTSRSIYNKCESCGSWHNPKYSCPPDNELYKYSKWKHSYGFKKEENFYNYWFAKEHIKKTGVVILTESPGNIWRLEETGIHTGLATYGASLTDKQKCLLNQTGAMGIIIAMDNDEAGLKCMEQINQDCKKTHKIYKFIPLKNDIGDMTVEEISQTLLPLYNGCLKDLSI